MLSLRTNSRSSWWVLAAAALLSTGLWPAQAEAGRRSHAAPLSQVVVLFDGFGFRGKPQALPAGNHDIQALSIGNDRVSSVRVPAGWRVILFEHPGFVGRQLILTAHTPVLPPDFNDITSSVVVEAPTPVPPPPAGRPVEAGPLRDGDEAGQKCPLLCRRTERWTGRWWTVTPGRMSMCECGPLAAPPGVPPSPPPPPMPPPPPSPVGPRRPVEAGPLWHQADADRKCPTVCRPPERWTGQWWTTVQGRMSVCECEGRVVVVEAPPPAEPVRPPPAAPLPIAMADADFQAFRQRVVDASFPKDQLAAVHDQVGAGGRFRHQHVIQIMEIVSFPEWQVKVATAMWPSVVDPQNAPAVVATLTFESHREQLRRALGLK